MVIAFFRLIRPLNLFIIALTQILVHYFLIIPLLEFNNSESSLSNFQFIQLVLSTILVAMGGYIINDIKDLKVDLINKPERVIINNPITRPTGLKLYVGLTILGVVMGAYLAYSIDMIAMGSIHFLSAGLLFFYSTSYKKIFILGTTMVSIITAFSITIVMLFDLNALSNIVIVKFIFAYSLFAFLITFVREILKDVEDMKGDQYQKAATLPLILGIKTTKNVAAVLIALIITLLFVVTNYQYLIKDYVSLAYVSVLVIFPLFVLMYNTIIATEKFQFSHASKLAKLIMLLGILYIPVFYLVLFKIQ